MRCSYFSEDSTREAIAATIAWDQNCTRLEFPWNSPDHLTSHLVPRSH